MNPSHLSFKRQAQEVDVSLPANLCGEEVNSPVFQQILGSNPSVPRASPNAPRASDAPHACNFALWLTA